MDVRFTAGDGNLFIAGIPTAGAWVDINGRKLERRGTDPHVCCMWHRIFRPVPHLYNCLYMTFSSYGTISLILSPPATYII